MMKGTMLGVALVYFLLVANFHNESHGFTKYYNSYYAFWKCTPIAFLILFSLLHGGGMAQQMANYAALGLVMGGVGDFLIGQSHDGIVTGAIAFGIGHLVYMSLFYKSGVALHWPSALAVLGWSAMIGHICLSPLLFTQTVPVLIMSVYSLTLSACLIVSISQYINRSPDDDTAPLLSRLLGFALFFSSDTLLILNHTGVAYPMAELLILGSYYSAQFFILNSFVADAHVVPIVHKKTN